MSLLLENLPSRLSYLVVNHLFSLSSTAPVILKKKTQATLVYVFSVEQIGRLISGWGGKLLGMTGNGSFLVQQQNEAMATGGLVLGLLSGFILCLCDWINTDCLNIVMFVDFV